MVVSTVKPEQLVESLGKEKYVLIPFSEYQALLDRLKELEQQTTQEHGLSALADSQAALNPISLKGVWGPVVVDKDDFDAARRSLFKSLDDENL